MLGAPPSEHGMLHARCPRLGPPHMELRQDSAAGSPWQASKHRPLRGPRPAESFRRFTRAAAWLLLCGFCGTRAVARLREAAAARASRSARMRTDAPALRAATTARTHFLCAPACCNWPAHPNTSNTSASSDAQCSRPAYLSGAGVPWVIDGTTLTAAVNAEPLHLWGHNWVRRQRHRRHRRLWPRNPLIYVELVAQPDFTTHRQGR